MYLSYDVIGEQEKKYETERKKGSFLSVHVNPNKAAASLTYVWIVGDGVDNTQKMLKC